MRPLHPSSLNILFLFLDGIGLGENVPEKNPFARAEMPTLQSMLGGQKLTCEAAHVPLLLFGSQTHRREFQNGIHDLTGIAPAISKILDL